MIGSFYTAFYCLAEIKFYIIKFFVEKTKNIEKKANKTKKV